MLRVSCILYGLAEFFVCFRLFLNLNRWLVYVLRTQAALLIRNAISSQMELEATPILNCKGDINMIDEGVKDT
jgi:hypothetical protein